MERVLWYGTFLCVILHGSTRYRESRLLCDAAEDKDKWRQLHFKTL